MSCYELLITAQICCCGFVLLGRDASRGFGFDGLLCLDCDLLCGYLLLNFDCLLRIVWLLVEFWVFVL